MPGTPAAHIRLAALAAATALLVGCGVQIPTDPEGTADRVRNATLRVGITHNPPWTDIAGAGDPGGTEADLVEAFAAELGAGVA